MVSPQTWVLALADTSQWYVDTSDLTELDVVKLKRRTSGQVTADALPGVTMDWRGGVDQRGTHSAERGYPVHGPHPPEESDPRLLWGMTMEVTFTP